MSTVRSLLALDFDFADGADASRLGHIVERRGALKSDRANKRLRFEDKSYLEIAKSEQLKKLTSFTLEVQFSLDRLGTPQQIVEGESLPVSVQVAKDGEIIASVETTAGRESVGSGSRHAVGKEEVSVRVILDDAARTLSLEIDDHHAASTALKGTLKRSGDRGLVVGTKLDGRSGQFLGYVRQLRIRDGAVDAMGLSIRQKWAAGTADRLRKQLKYKGVLRVEADPDAVDHRFDRIKAILAAAGVQDLSQLATLRIDRRTVIPPNTLMIAPRKGPWGGLDWKGLAGALATAEATTATLQMASVLPNRHSAIHLQADASAQTSAGTASRSSVENGIAARAALRTADLALLSRGDLPARLDPITPLHQPTIGEFIRPARDIKVIDPRIIQAIQGDRPSEWPIQMPPLFSLVSLVTIPVSTSVIIAGTLDLTNQQIVIEPTVETLYIIAEEVIGTPSAVITWRRPGGLTPSVADDASKNGRSFSGVATADGSRNGLRGGDGLDGVPGQNAANGIDAPNVELWVKRLTAMPDIDLNGEEGIKGGRGQRGGRGGNGARGAPGEWWWAFGVRCWKSPGHGGNGGNGGDGGRGGGGGDGGRGGNVAIGVLEGTLAATVTARAFRIKNQGGAVGRGGNGGFGGAGGRGGSFGNDYHDGELVCGDGLNGTDGAQGQRGTDGADGRLGQDGTLNFFEFTEESWNEQLTKPWLYELSPVEIFPGNTLTITGTRFADTDRVILPGYSLMPTILPDESISVTVPLSISGGEKELFVKRFDGAESNRLRLRIKPQLDAVAGPVVRGGPLTLPGRAFLAGASVLVDGAVVAADSVTANQVRFTVPPAGAGDVPEESLTFAVRNPDGLISNSRTLATPRVIDSGFRVDVHGLSFGNFDDGTPTWGTFETTYGALEVWHELLDPVFGHPVLTAAFYGFYHYFLIGQGNGGLATGYCTSLSAKVLDEFWTGSSDTFSRVLLTPALRTELTAIHGRLLSRESLLDFHDQGRNGTANVATSFRRIEQNLRDGGDRESALMLFFTPSGEIWDGGYFDKLSDSHCIVPYRIVYPVGHDGTSIAGCTLFCWDCNHPFDATKTDAANCRLVFRQTDGEIRFDYFDGGTSAQFRSEDGITLATMTVGKYLLSDHDLPFSGPLGLTRFVIDFLLSPADIIVENALGQQTGRSGDAILAQIPGSHPFYLARGAYMLPADQAFIRRITGTGAGTYSLHSIAPNGTSISLQNVDTSPGQVDILATNADATSIRFTPGATKSFTLNFAREVAGQARAVTIAGAGAGPTTAVDIALSPDLSVIRLSNTDVARSVDVQVGQISKESGANAKLNRNGVPLPTDNDLVVTVTDWADLALTVRTLPFA
jgi:hypothetical protein